MAKKKAAKKKKKAAATKEVGTPPVPTQTTEVGTPPVPPLAQPYVPPGEQQFAMYKPVPDSELAQHQRQLSLDQVRVYIAQKVKELQTAGLACPDALYTDIENVVIWLQTADIGDVVRSYVRLMETSRFWHVYCEEQTRKVERQRKYYQRQLMDYHRSDAATRGEKVTKDAVETKARVDVEHEKWLGYQESWEFLGKQIHQIIVSMQTEMLVQSSVWTQHELGMRNVTPAGAVGH